MPSASPWCSVCPSLRGSIAAARRRARANALKAASIMWWALLPVSTRTCSVSFAALANARKNSSVSLVLEAARRPGRERGLEQRERAPEMSIAQLARASSIGTVAQP